MAGKSRYVDTYFDACSPTTHNRCAKSKIFAQLYDANAIDTCICLHHRESFAVNNNNHHTQPTRPPAKPKLNPNQAAGQFAPRDHGARGDVERGDLRAGAGDQPVGHHRLQRRREAAPGLHVRCLDSMACHGPAWHDMSQQQRQYQRQRAALRRQEAIDV